MEGEGEDEEFVDLEDETDAAKERAKKSNWKTVGISPVSCGTYPCDCRWRLKFPKKPCPKYKHMRWIALPVSDRINQLALPLLRRVLALWLKFGDKFPPEMRNRFMTFVSENYGLREEFLEHILEEARKANERPEPKKKKGKRKIRKGKKKAHKRKKKEKRQSKEPMEKIKEKPVASLGFKRRKAGNLPLDWPHKMGSRFILMYTSYLSQDPDEDYNSRATEYFDVQSMGILDEICKFLDMPLPDPDKPTQCGETLVIMALNLSNWIAKWVVTPAQEIPDDKVEEYLDLRGMQPKPTKEKNTKDKEKKRTEPKQDSELVQTPSPEGDHIKNIAWKELKSPTYVPPKTRVSKRTPLPVEEDENENDADYSADMEINKYGKEDSEEDEEGAPRWQKPTLDDVKREFLGYLNWYNPREPEFVYLGPRTIPKGVNMFKIWDADSDEIPSDLRVLNWNITELGYTENYSFIPSPVPQYYPSLRPLRPVRLEDVERSGIPEEVIRQNLRFFSPWYIMSRTLTQRESEFPIEEHLVREKSNENDDGDAQPETEEHFDDEMLRPSGGPSKVKDSVWGDYKMKEQLEILGHVLHLTTSVPDLTIEHVFQLLEEFCDAVECAESDENPSEENLLLLKKRTIILERYYFNFFGKKFRDYNDRTPYYMRKICSRCAYYIQLLYEYTARNLWELQSRANQPNRVERPSEPPDDPQALQDWDEWIVWLLKVTKTCDKWAAWISETVDDAERKAAKKKGEYIGSEGKPERLTKREWIEWKKNVEGKIHDYRSARKLHSKESGYYLEKSKTIMSVMHRPITRWEDEQQAEGDEEEGEWENLSDSEDENSRKYLAAIAEEGGFAEMDYEDNRENDSF